MNDLKEIRQVLGEPELPSQPAYTAARAALLRRAQAGYRAPAGRAPRPRIGWLAGGLGLTAATMAAVVAVATAGAPPAASHRGHKTQAAPVSRLSGRQILLDVATAAAAEPTRTGTYWYVKEAVPAAAGISLSQSWYTQDGSQYVLLPPGNSVVLTSQGAGFSIGASSLTYRQIQDLPADPVALTAWIIRSLRHPVLQPVPPGLPRATYSPPPRAELHADVANALFELLGEDPAPPAIRAAAFRALAALPNVTRLAQTGTDVMLRITGTGEMKLTIDTSTMALRAWSDYTGTITILASRWTNTLPPVSK